jgi:hypothetical protein
LGPALLLFQVTPASTAEERPLAYLEVVVVASIAAVNVIGCGVLVRWLVRQINALKGAVAAHEQTIQAVGTLNRTVLEVFKGPERWAKEVEIHKRLADEKAAALVEREREKWERQLKARVDESDDVYLAAAARGNH